MSRVAIRKALEVALDGIAPGIDTAWENAEFKPTSGKPYQSVALLFAQPLHDEISPSYQELGFLQVTLCYPLGTGPNAADARADLIKTTFPRGADFIADSLTTSISDEPEILPAFRDGDRYCLPVRVRFYTLVTV